MIEWIKAFFFFICFFFFLSFFWDFMWYVVKATINAIDKFEARYPDA